MTDERVKNKKGQFKKPYRYNKEYASRKKKRRYPKDLRRSLKELQKHFNENYHAE